ncbi:hypothetical protein KJ910_00130 [Patescibacteria group bacterium]|nr:hypothetical protein [Patescibacteria group bacterium]MBU1906591.1 hypothetical protein [Patescibacteria group bacterium]
MLNCKNLHQYLNAFAEWLVKQCLTPESAQEELDLWVTKFRILYYQDLTEARLSEIERTARAYIVHRAHLDLLIYGEARRAALLEQDAVSLGLIAG